VVGATATTGTRPRNRKELIIQAAGEMFHERGYHAVGLSEIAARVGVSAPALYRHFRSKQDLLSASVSSGISELEQATRGHSLDDTLAAMASVCAQRRDIAVLWQRETRYLSERDRDAVRFRLVRLVDRLARLVRAERPALGADDAKLIGWAVAAALASPSHHQIEPATPKLAGLLHRMTRAIADVDVAPCVGSIPPVTGAAKGIELRSRRERLVSVAVDLFGRHGYHEVSVDDIGAAAGIAGPTVYKHFGAKGELLAAALNRGATALQFELAATLSGAASPADALDALVDRYVRFSLDHRALVAALITEVIHLPDDDRHALRRTQHDYVNEWVNLLVSRRPELDATSAGVLVHGALGVINDTQQVQHLAARPCIAQELAALARAVLRVI
jgi:AcrR family transcriptional regulator